MIFGRHIYCPDFRLIRPSRNNIANGFKCRHHGVIHVIVTVLSVSSDAVKIREHIQIRLDFIKSGIGIKICRISFLDHLFMEIQNHGRIINDSHFYKFGYRKRLPLDITLIPVIIPFVTEVLKTDPDGLFRLGYKIRRPIVVNLDSSEFYGRILNINPAIRRNVVQGFILCRIFNFKLRNQKSKDDKISVGKSSCNFQNVCGNILHTENQVLNRHG